MLSPDGRLIVTQPRRSNELTIKRVDDGSIVTRIPGGNEAQSALAVSPDDALVAVDHSNADAPAISVADARTGATLYTLRGVDGGAAFSPDGQTLATLEPQRRALLLWDARSGRFLQRRRGSSGVFGPPVFSPDGRHILTVANKPRTPPHSDGSFALNASEYPQLDLNVWNTGDSSGPRRIAFMGDSNQSYNETGGSFAFVDDSHVIVTARQTTTVVTDLAGAGVTTLIAGGTVVRSDAKIELLNDDRWLELRAGELHDVARFAKALTITDAALSIDGKLAAVSGANVVVWDLADPAASCATTLDGEARDPVFDAAGRLGVRSYGNGGRLVVQGCVRVGVPGPPPQNEDIRSPDGSRILRFSRLSSTDDALRLELFDARSRKRVASVAGVFSGPQLGGYFAAHASILAIRSRTGVLVLDSSGKTRLTAPAGDTFALSADGSKLAVVSKTATTMYDTRTGRSGPAYPSLAIAQMLLTPNATAIIGLTSDGVLQLQTPAGVVIATFTLASLGGKPVWAVTLPSGDYISSPHSPGLVFNGTEAIAVVRRALEPALR